MSLNLPIHAEEGANMVARIRQSMNRHENEKYFHIIGNMKNKDAISVFLALGQDSRLNVYRLIVQRGPKGLSPGEIVEQLGIPNATISFHLKELTNAKLLSVERVGRHLIYRANFKLITDLCDFLLENCCAGESCLATQTKL